ncbi:MAG: TetR/AcrR family transcriptional regulator [Rhizobiaceae bacterium]
MDQQRSKVTAPRQPRAVATRNRLLDAVERLVAAEGHEAVTTTRLATEIGVAVGTIYRYFADRDAVLLAAYDATVERIVAACERQLRDLPVELPPTEAARALLDGYLAAAAAIPGHVSLLGAMRSIRPIEADQQGENLPGIVEGLLIPFLARYLPQGIGLEPARLAFVAVMVGTMVDLYLVTADGGARASLRREIDAHVGLMVDRILAPLRHG